MGVIHKVAHCDEGVTQSFCRCDPFVSIQTEHPLQEIYKLSSISFLSQHIRPLQMRRQVDLEYANTQMGQTNNTRYRYCDFMCWCVCVVFVCRVKTVCEAKLEVMREMVIYLHHVI